MSYQCSTEDSFAFTEEIMYFTMNVDSNDIEGIAFRDYAQSKISYCDDLENIDIKTAVNDPNCWTKISANG